MKLLGDVYLDRSYDVDIELGDYIFNLEYALSREGIPAKNKINLGVDTPNILETFKKMPTAVNLANNHIMDYGEEAFKKTLSYLEKNDVGYFGAGNKKNNYNNPLVITSEDKKIAFLGYSCPSTHPVFGSEIMNGSAILDIDLIIKDINGCKNNVDFIVVNLHWGDEEIIYPKATDVKIAHMIIDAGADLIIGHHAHVIQSIETYKKKKIFYGIGNFIFPDFDVPSSYDGTSFSNNSTKKQLKSNKQTVIVNLDEKLNVTYETAVFENGVVKNKNISIPKWIPKKQIYYNLYKIFWSKKRMLEGFVRNPRIPTLKQVKLVFGVKI